VARECSPARFSKVLLALFEQQADGARNEPVG
jgi:hypothetical protein